MKYVFVHGLGQHSTSWEKTISFMENPNNAVCPDLHFFLHNKEISYANLYQVFSDYCMSISEPLTLCGLSLGGVLALNYAIDYPIGIQSLLLVATQYKMPQRLLKFQNAVFQLMPERLFEKKGLQKKDAINLTNSMMDLDFTAELKSISCATLAICGENDRANKRATKMLAQNIPNAKFYYVENAGHEVNIDAPKELATILNNFL